MTQKQIIIKHHIGTLSYNISNLLRPLKAPTSKLLNMGLSEIVLHGENRLTIK